MKCQTCNKELQGRFKIKFCSRSCSAKFNNKKFPKRQTNGEFLSCLNCNKEIYRRPNQIKKNIGKFCSNKCCREHSLKNKIQLRIDKFKNGNLTYRSQIKKIILEKNGHKCSNCGLETWLNNPIPLWLDHIDGNASNNLPSNFRLVCLNCDALSNTFGGKNRGKGRRSLGLKPWA